MSTKREEQTSADLRLPVQSQDADALAGVSALAGGFGLAHAGVHVLDDGGDQLGAEFVGSVDGGSVLVGDGPDFSHAGDRTTRPRLLTGPMDRAYSIDMTNTEYALMIDWGTEGIEYVPANSPEHADRMAETIYAGQSCWTVGREIQPWRYVRRADAVLTDEVAR